MSQPLFPTHIIKHLHLVSSFFPVSRPSNINWTCCLKDFHAVGKSPLSQSILGVEPNVVSTMTVCLQFWTVFPTFHIGECPGWSCITLFSSSIDLTPCFVCHLWQTSLTGRPGLFLDYMWRIYIVSEAVTECVLTYMTPTWQR